MRRRRLPVPCVQTDRRVLKQGEALTFRPHHGVAGHGSARGCNVRNAVVNEADARRLVEQLALCWGASLCLRHEPEIADAYIRSRLDGDWGSEFGTLSSNVNLGFLSRRACPV